MQRNSTTFLAQFRVPISGHQALERSRGKKQDFTINDYFLDFERRRKRFKMILLNKN